MIAERSRRQRNTYVHLKIQRFKDIKKAFRVEDDCQSQLKSRMVIRIKFEMEIMWPRSNNGHPHRDARTCVTITYDCVSK
jgi:hypothetical protein